MENRAAAEGFSGGLLYPHILLLLDIYLTGMSGIETARCIRNILPEVQIAFLTSAREYALDAFDLYAVHYLIKPVNSDSLRELFRRFFRYLHRSEKYLEIHSDSKNYTFPLEQVQKIQSNNKGVDIYLKNIYRLFRSAHG